jgi:hypothetical protein
VSRGTASSNPAPSSGESGANSIPGLSFDHLGSVLQKEATRRRDQGDETLAEIGRSYNVSAAV